MNLFNKLFGNKNHELTGVSKLLENKSVVNKLELLENCFFGFSELNFFKPINLEKMQVGYSVDPNGKLLTGKNPGMWKESWVVIATDDIGDPVLVDTKDTHLSVYFAPHGEGSWEETKIADSLLSFVDIINRLNQLSVGRETPESLENNTLTDYERDVFLAETESSNPDSEYWYWSNFIELPDED